jgi:hypothetical protein
VTPDLLQPRHLADHQRIAAEAAATPVTPDTLPELVVLLGLTLGLLGRDLLLACIDRDLAGATTDRE